MSAEQNFTQTCLAIFSVFNKGQPFNQGNIYTWDSDNVAECMDLAVSKKGQNNAEGEILKEEFSYSRSVDRLLKGIKDMN